MERSCTWNIALLFTLTLAMAQAGHAASAPIEHKQGAVAVLHGGVGAEERAAMQARAGEYNLHLTFASKGSGAYLSQVRVGIRDAKGGSVLDVIASGPWLYARLPAGEFSVSATSGKQTLTQKLAIPATGRRDWVFRFDVSSGE